MTTATHALYVWARPWQRFALRVALDTLVKHGHEAQTIKWDEGDEFWSRLFILRGSREQMSMAYRFFTNLCAEGRGGTKVFTNRSGVERIDRDSKVEFDGLTFDGLRAAVIMVPMGHRCGYVGVPKGHPLHGARYNVPHPALNAVPESEPVCKRSPIILFCVQAGNLEAPSPEIAFDVHGGITYAGRAYWHATDEANKADDRWYFGFDAAHCNDLPAPDSEMGEFNREFDAKHPEYAGVRDGRVHRTKDYMVRECDRLAEQIVGPKVRKKATALQWAAYYLRVAHKVFGGWWYMKKSRLAYTPWVMARPKLQKFIRGF